MHRHLLGTLKHGFVFSEQGLREEHRNPAIIKFLDEETTGAVPAAERGDNHRGVEDEAHGSRLSHIDR